MSKYGHIKIVPPKVHVLAQPTFHIPIDSPFSSDATTAAELLAEFAARSMYQTWDKPRKATESHRDFIKHLFEVGNVPVLDHAYFTLYIQGISRDAAHEFYHCTDLHITELSPRYFPEDYSEIILSPVLEPYKTQILQAIEQGYEIYQACISRLLEEISPLTSLSSQNHPQVKALRHALMGLTPRISATELTVSGSVMAWRHFIAHYGVDRIDHDLRVFARLILESLQPMAPALFSDFVITAAEPEGFFVISVLSED